jgi:quercetin dioxygenase-like cupin family protein
MTTEVAPAAFLSGTDEGGRLVRGQPAQLQGDRRRSHGRLALAGVRVPRGSGSPVHTHRHEDGTWYLLEGELTFGLGEESRTATTGDFVFGPRGVRQRFRIDSEVARFLILVTPAGSRTSPERAAGRRWPGPSRLPPVAKKNSSSQLEGTASTSLRRSGQVTRPTGPMGPTLGEAMPDAPRSVTVRSTNAQGSTS